MYYCIIVLCLLRGWDHRDEKHWRCLQKGWDDREMKYTDDVCWRAETIERRDTLTMYTGELRRSRKALTLSAVGQRRLTDTLTMTILGLTGWHDQEMRWRWLLVAWQADTIKRCADDDYWWPDRLTWSREALTRLLVAWQADTIKSCADDDYWWPDRLTRSSAVLTMTIGGLTSWHGLLCAEMTMTKTVILMFTTSETSTRNLNFRNNALISDIRKLK